MITEQEGIKRNLERTLYVLSGILVFVLSIKVLRESVSVLTPFLKSIFLALDLSPVNSLAFGWLTSYAIMSGSPIAALSLNLFDAGVIGTKSSFLMVFGSRLGAAFILVAIGLVEYLRGKSDLVDSMSVALLTFIVTYLVFIPGLAVSYLLFHSHFMKYFSFAVPSGFITAIDSFFGPVSSFFLSSIGAPLSFFLSLVLLYLSLSTFDRAFQGIEVKEAKSSWINYMMRKTYFSFILGALVTLAAQSVSLSLGIIVPLYLKGYVQRRDIIPYIMGANLTTFIDTFFVALILNNVVAQEIVIAVMVGNLIVTALFLIGYKYTYEIIVRSMNYLLSHEKAIAVFMILLFLIPGALFLV